LPGPVHRPGRGVVSSHALEVLEFERVLDGIARRASSELGQDRVRSLRPGSDVPAIQDELERVDQVARFLHRSSDWGMPEIPDASAALKHLGLAGSVLEPGELFLLGRLLAAGRGLAGSLDKGEDQLPGLLSVRERLFKDPSTEKAIDRTVERDGTVLDTASRDLGRVRDRLRKAHNRIVRSLESYLRTLPERIVVPDASVTLREGRYVIPVRREGRGEVGGVVMDESATGATLFVEPPLSMELMNELRELEREEAREIQRILRGFSDTLRSVHTELVASQDALADFDCVLARALAALAWDGFAPRLLPPGTQDLEIVNGRHPLLLATGEGSVVPFDLRLEEGERVVVVSGPNTGGKSVLLKAVGLIVTLSQSGVVPPVGEGTRLPFFAGVFADIGDEQSISESLSTFSAHLGNLKEIVLEANGESLVLIDEMGTGTDPQEGAALSMAILEELARRSALTVVTSHLGALKRLDTPGSGVVNASLQFDPDRIEPTYQLSKGIPGRSYGLAIARRLGFPEEILDRAETLMPQEELRMEDLLAALERKEGEAARLVDSLSREQARVRELRRELQAREEELGTREKTAEARAREEARQLLLDARKEVEEAIRDVRSAGEDVAERDMALEEASRSARRRVEEAARAHQSRSRARKTGRPRST